MELDTPEVQQTVEERITHYHNILADNPADFDANYELGIILFRGDSFDEARKHFQTAVTENPTHVFAQYYIGLCFERESIEPGDANYVKAVKYYKMANRLDPSFDKAIEKLQAASAVLAEESEAIPASLQQRTPSNATPSPASPATPSIIGEPGELIMRGRRRMRSFSFFFCLSCLFFIIGPSALMVIADKDVIGLTLLLVGGGIVIQTFLFIASRVTVYEVYENRIDFHVGLFFRKHVSIWKYQIEDIWLTRTPFNLITGDASMKMFASSLETQGSKSTDKGGNFIITGLGNAKAMKLLWDDIRDEAMKKRREAKNFFV